MKSMVQWHHAPLHVFVPGACYMVTGGTLRKQHFFADTSRLDLLQSCLLAAMQRYGWEVRAWSVFSNHYHVIAQAPADNVQLSEMMRYLHSRTAREINRDDGAQGRQIWHQYWDKCLTYERSYLARLKYVAHNAVHHGLVDVASDYPYCSATWFEQKCDAGFLRKLESFACDRINEADEYEPIYP